MLWYIDSELLESDHFFACFVGFCVTQRFVGGFVGLLDVDGGGGGGGAVFGDAVGV